MYLGVFELLGVPSTAWWLLDSTHECDITYPIQISVRKDPRQGNMDNSIRYESRLRTHCESRRYYESKGPKAHKRPD